MVLFDKKISEAIVDEWKTSLEGLLRVMFPDLADLDDAEIGEWMVAHNAKLVTSDASAEPDVLNKVVLHVDDKPFAAVTLRKVSCFVGSFGFAIEVLGCVFLYGLGVSAAKITPCRVADFSEYTEHWKYEDECSAAIEKARGVGPC